MTLRLARTSAEAHLFLALTPCDICGEAEFRPDHGVIVVDGDLASQYAGVCPQCEVPREFVFRIPAEVILPEGDIPVFGAEQPSELIDAGQWLWFADRLSAGLPAHPGPELTAAQRRQIRIDLLTAAAAVAETVKFVPAGAEAVPQAAFWSETGREVHAREPGRFLRSRLEVVRRTYQEIADRF